MPDIDTATLTRLATAAFERTAFMLVDPIDEADPAKLTTHARIDYFGAGEGSVFVSASEGFIVELASSLLGVEPDEVTPQSEGADAIREIANILAGSLLTTLGGGDHAFRLGLPAHCEAPDHAATTASCTLESEGEPLVFTWVDRAAQTKAA